MSQYAQGELTMESLAGARGSAVYASDGEAIGKVEEIFYDEETRRPEWLGIGTGFFGTKRVLVPVEGAALENDGLTVPYSKDHVKDGPDIDSDTIEQDTERALYSHYGLSYSTERSDTGLPDGAPRGGGTTADADSMTRAEEELRVGKQSVETGTVRLRKWVETEPVETDVELRRETAHVERETIDQPVADAQLGEQEVEIELRAERPVVEKRTVAKERISVGKDVETETQRVSDEVRKERVELDGDEFSSR